MGFAPTDWCGWQFDTTVLLFGRWVESKLQERDKKGRPVHTLKELTQPYQAQRHQQQYASLMGRVSHKVKVKPDGTWD